MQQLMVHSVPFILTLIVPSSSQTKVLKVVTKSFLPLILERTKGAEAV